MTASPHDASPAYGIAQDGTVQLNETGLALEAQYRAIAPRYEALQSNWAQAEIAALFVRHPSVLAIDLQLSASWEYDDSGGHYLSGSCRVDEVCLDAACPQVEEFMDGGEPDVGEAAAQLESELDDVSHDLALVLLHKDGSEDRRLTCKREEVLAQFGQTSNVPAPAPATTGTPSPSR